MWGEQKFYFLDFLEQKNKLLLLIFRSFLLRIILRINNPFFKINSMIEFINIIFIYKDLFKKFKYYNTYIYANTFSS